MTDIADRTNARLRFIGYTTNERLDRRTARCTATTSAFAAARAPRDGHDRAGLMQLCAGAGGARGPRLRAVGRRRQRRASPRRDVVRRVQVVYDEPALLDDYEGVDITPLTRELSAEEPVRAEPDAHHRGRRADRRSGPQLRRRPALHRRRARTADIQFQFDNLTSSPRLSVSAWPTTPWRS